MTHRIRLVLMGAVGGCAGSLLGELANSGVGEEFYGSVVGAVAVWGAALGTPIALMLGWGIALNRKHRWLPATKVISVMIAGALAGGLSAGLAQYAFNQFDAGWFKQVIARTACWAGMGGLLGFCLSFGVPNLPRWRGGVLGAVGGLVGGAVFLTITRSDLPEILARASGIAALGALIGLAIAVAESAEAKRGAYLSVTYGPKETVKMPLGRDPITFGESSSDTVYVRGLKTKSLQVILLDGTVRARQLGGPEVTLKDGSTIKVGALLLTIRHA